MKSKLLVTTAALALMLSAGAQAQTRSETKPDQPSASQSQKEHGSATKEMNRDARDTDRAKGGTTTGQSSPNASASDSKASDSKSSDSKSSPDSKSATDTKSDTRKPASAQDTSPSHNNAAQSTDKANDKSTGKANGTASDKSNAKASDKTNAAKQDDKSTTSDRSKQANEPRDSKSNTAGQTDSKQPSSAQRDSDRNQATTKSTTDDRSRDTADSKSQSTTRISATLKTEQKTRLQQAVTKLDVKPVTNVNFSVSVGTAVPRTVTLHRVPSTIVEIVPQYRDYDYFVVREEVIIVHPETHKIVDVIERGGGSSRASVSTSREKRVKLSDKQRSYIRQHATSRRTTTTTTTTGSAPRGQTTIVVGEEVPQSVEIESFPEEVYREVPTVREYRYIRSGSNMYLVDPGTRHVIEEIE